ncbi:GNAT family N-acetyltransferase [Luteipulveratus flavus]|uniref:GNAT family N-acetyltransferase n=1 Tax=Luteipulveratus flavus TaxID=3031728 RepID=A0ABT6C8D6_9MICO|nr:GNAT family N-acetyltransferase [Luteipulveratus sp. YIM 133296]MDF8264981.1 GNAT family N-acetyltransferase [Luteipulveratus sp. YIM 133296]
MTNPDITALLRAYDDNLRSAAEVRGTDDVQRHGPLWLATYPDRGFVTYADLDGAEGEAVDELIAYAIEWFRDHSTVPFFEWKTRGHDLPADLPDRLVTHGFVAEEVESVMVGEAAGCVADLALPDGVTIRRLDASAPDLVGDIERMMDMQAEVFGQRFGDSAQTAERVRSEGDAFQLWVAEADGQVVTAGRLDVVPGTEFAGVWGGSTRPEWRGRGIYRALTAERARAALTQGVRYLHSDSTEYSRPILERSGLVKITTTTPYIWTRPTG